MIKPGARSKTHPGWLPTLLRRLDNGMRHAMAGEFPRAPLRDAIKDQEAG